MKLHRVIDSAYQNFTEQSQHAQVTLLHPRSRYRSLIVAQLLSDPQKKTYYYALSPDDINLQSFISGLAHDLANQYPMFGRHLNLLLPDVLSDMQRLLTTFARELAEMSSEPYYLILDEYDRSDIADDIQWFMQHLFALLPEQCRLVINSRTLPRLSWVSTIARKHTIILDDDSIVRHNFYNLQGGSQRLEVYALGPGFVMLNDRPIETWEGHLPRLLFFFALDRPVVTRSEICQTFWSELDDEQAVNVFHVTKRRLHKALNMDVLLHVDGYYRINPEFDVHYDVMNFVSHLMDGRDTLNASPIASYQRAADIYRGPFLQGHADSWIVERRQDFQAGLLEALMAIASERMKEERFDHALGLYQRALAENALREDLHRELMRLYARIGRRSEAAAHFQQLSDALTLIGRTPDGETRSLYDDIIIAG